MTSLTAAQAQLFEGPNLGVLGTLRRDSTMHLTPVWVGWDGEAILVNTVVNRVKHKHLERDPRVSIVVTDAGDPTRYVSVTGVANLVLEGANEQFYEQASKYLRDEAALAAFAKESAASGDRRIIIRITPLGVMHWNVGD